MITLGELLYSARVGIFIRCMIGDIDPAARPDWIREIDLFTSTFNNYLDDQIEDIDLFIRPGVES